MIGIVVTGFAAAALLGAGEYAAAGLILAVCLRARLTPGQREMALRIVDFATRAGLVFRFRDFLPGESLALLALFGAFTEAHVSVVAPGVKVARIERRLLLTVAASVATAVSGVFWSTPYPMLAALVGHIVWTHSAAAAAGIRILGAARRRRRPVSAFAQAPVLR